jgi:hypothetical protein
MSAVSCRPRPTCPGTYCTGDWIVLTAGLDVFVEQKQKNLLLLSEFELGPSSPQLNNDKRRNCRPPSSLVPLSWTRGIQNGSHLAATVKLPVPSQSMTHNFSSHAAGLSCSQFITTNTRHTTVTSWSYKSTAHIEHIRMAVEETKHWIQMAIHCLRCMLRNTQR